jgi:acyl-CoA synthetase (AMP-forming)/AMP-acid ligase II
MSLSRIVEHHADRLADCPALAFGEERLTYAELAGRARRTAAALAHAGAHRGDVVGALLHNSLDFLEVMLGADYLGAVFMPLNWRLAPPEVAYIVGHAGTSVLVSEPELEPMIEPVRGELTCSLVRAGANGSDGWNGLDEMRAAAEPLSGPEPTEPGDLLRLMYTSGTTARPKGVMITHGNLDAKCLAHVAELGLGREDRGLIAGPLYHVGALDLTFTTLLYLGCYQRILRKFATVEVLDAIERERLSTIWLAPAMVKLLLDDESLPGRDVSSMRVIIDGGEKMPLPLIDRLLTSFPGAWFADAYGLTETVSGDTFLNKGKERDKLGSVGKPVFNVDLRLVKDDGTEAAAGEEGEIVIRGPKVSVGYWRDPEATARAHRDGWFRTGDVGVFDADGYLYIVDRLKDMILSGGENVASLEVERVLYEHEAVAEVAVVGRPHERWGEVPVAFVVLHDGATVDEDELLTFCRERLARYKAPKAVTFVDVLPRNPSGKVLKRELRELATKEVPA